jgi:L-alanine-DL-glutamate epimerase-like enolase superfamily enzyme
MGSRKPEAAVSHIETAAYVIPTATPESDGTIEWHQTTLVLVRAHGGGKVGLGYTYAGLATAKLIDEMLADAVRGCDLMDVPSAWLCMVHAIRNQGRPGIASMAISAVDAALWDLKARVLDVSLATLLGRARDRIPIYGSGGFTSYSAVQLRDQLGGWVDQGIRKVKMKVGRDAEADPGRVRLAREAIGNDAALFVDANGAYSRKQALALAEVFAQQDVSWFEEPVSSDDLEGLRLLRDRAPAGMDIAAGEYGYDLPYFRRMLESGAVDILQADATRCGGITVLMQAGALCEARSLPLSSHCAPALHLHAMCALPQAVHMEYFFDHARIEQIFFDGVVQPERGGLSPDIGQPGMGLILKQSDANRFAA